MKRNLFIINGILLLLLFIGIAEGEIRDGMLSHYTFDGNCYDSLGNLRNCTKGASVYYNSSQVNILNQYANVSQRVGNNLPLNNGNYNVFNVEGGDYTLNAWVRAKIGTFPMIFWGKRSDGDDNFIQVYLPSGSRVDFYHSKIGNQDQITCNNASIDLTNKWNMITVTRNASNATCRIYINGTDMCSGQCDGNGTDTDDLWDIGGIILNNGADFVGALDEAAIWNRPLTPAEITELYNSGRPLTIRDILPPFLATPIYPLNGTVYDNMNYVNFTLENVTGTSYCYTTDGAYTSFSSKTNTSYNLDYEANIQNVTVYYYCSDTVAGYSDWSNGSLSFYNRNTTRPQSAKKLFTPLAQNFTYNSSSGFLVDWIYINDTCIQIEGAIGGAVDGIWCYNLTKLELTNKLLFAGSSETCTVEYTNFNTTIAQARAIWLNTSGNPVKTDDWTYCAISEECILDELQSSYISFNDNISCRAQLNESWFTATDETAKKEVHTVGVCSDSVSHKIVNISYYDELTNNKITMSNGFDLLFFDGDSYLNFSGNFTGNYSDYFCTDIDPATDGTINLEMSGDMILSKSSYLTRVISIDPDEALLVSNNPYYNYSFYLIGISNSSTITYTWQTTNFQYIDGTMIIERCNPDGSRSLIESTPITGGTATANLQLYTTAYSYSVVIDGRTYTDASYHDCHVESIASKNYYVDTTVLDVLPVIGLFLIDCQLSNSSNTVTMSWNANIEDPTDLEACLIGYRDDLYGRTEIYRSCENKTSGSIIRIVPVSSYDYYVVGEITQNGVTGYCKNPITFHNRSDTSTSLGGSGILAAIILFLGLILIYAGDDELVLFGGVVAIITAWFIGIISLDWRVVSSIGFFIGAIALIGRYTRKK